MSNPNCLNLNTTCPDGYSATKCLVYSGNALPCSGVLNGDGLDTVLKKIDDLLCLETPNEKIDTESITITLTGDYNRIIQADLNISTDEGNVAEIRDDGLYVPESSGISEDVPQDLQSVTDEGNVTTNFMECTGLGINESPTEELPFIVSVTGQTGIMFFDGVTLSVGSDTDNETSNVFVGNNAGDPAMGTRNSAFGIKALAKAVGDNNTAIGRATGISIKSDDNTFVGTYAGHDTDDGRNVFVGANSGSHTYADSTICIGVDTYAGALVFADSIPIANVNIGTSELKGSDITTFLSSAGLTAGDKGAFVMEFTGAPPNPLTSLWNAFKGYVTALDTIEIQDQSDFVDVIGAGSTFTLSYYAPATNAIVIGDSAAALADNNIAIGNDSSNLLVMNEFIVDLATAPTIGQILTWDGTKWVPGGLASGTYTTNGNGVTTAFVVTHGQGFAPSQVLISPNKADSWEKHWVSAHNSTTFTITFDVAPSSGTNNVSFDWQMIR